MSLEIAKTWVIRARAEAEKCQKQCDESDAQFQTHHAELIALRDLALARLAKEEESFRRKERFVASILEGRETHQDTKETA